VAGTSGTLTTQIVGAANKLVFRDFLPSSGSATVATPNGTCTTANRGAATDNACIYVRLLITDANGNRVTGNNTTVVTAALDANTCTGAGQSGTNNVAGAGSTSATTSTAASGGVTFAFTSTGAYSGCLVTFTATGLASTTATLVWTAGSPDHLSCKFAPANIPADSSATSVATVRVRDSLGNSTGTGTYSVTFTGGGASETLLTANPQTTSAGTTSFTVRSTAVQGTDTWTPTITSGSSPTLSGTNVSCPISVQN